MSAKSAPPAGLSEWLTIQYYGGRGKLDRLVADPAADIHEVVQEVERLCRGEAYAAEYYRKHPELLYASHPWMCFVASGGATHLGWYPDRDERRPDAP